MYQAERIAGAACYPKLRINKVYFQLFQYRPGAASPPLHSGYSDSYPTGTPTSDCKYSSKETTNYNVATFVTSENFPQVTMHDNVFDWFTGFKASESVHEIAIYVCTFVLSYTDIVLSLQHIIHLTQSWRQHDLQRREKRNYNYSWL